MRSTRIIDNILYNSKSRQDVLKSYSTPEIYELITQLSLVNNSNCCKTANELISYLLTERKSEINFERIDLLKNAIIKINKKIALLEKNMKRNKPLENLKFEKYQLLKKLEYEQQKAPEARISESKLKAQLMANYKDSLKVMNQLSKNGVNPFQKIDYRLNTLFRKIDETTGTRKLEKIAVEPEGVLLSFR